MVGALFGIIIANRMDFVKRAYGETPQSGKRIDHAESISKSPENSDGEYEEAYD